MCDMFLVMKNIILKTGLLSILISWVFMSGIFGQEANTKIIILYDNYQFSENTIADWGFSCLVISGNDTILFDTGARKDVFFHNVDALNIDLQTVQTLVISHHHGDHTGNIFPILEKTGWLDVYLPSSLNGKFRGMVDNYDVHTEVDQNIRQVAHNVFLTGEMGFQIREQGLILKTEKGLVLITGCGHPGVDRMLKKIKKKFDEPVYLILGGFHMEEYAEEEIDHVITSFNNYGVKKVAPGHCTGQRAMEKLRKAYQQNFIRSGTGKVIEL